MGFYALKVSRDGARLKLGMGIGLRISLIGALSLALASLFATGRWAGLSPASRLASAAICAVLALVAFYRDEYELDKAASTLNVRRGWGFLLRVRRLPLSDLRGIVLSLHGLRRPGFGEERRAGVVLDLGGRLVLLERSLPEAKARAMAAGLKAFMGEAFEIRTT